MSKTTPGTGNRILRVCRLLNEHDVLYVLCGGVAANLHGVVRATKDVDILVPKDRANMERLLTALSRLPNGVARELDVDEILDKPIVIVGDEPRVDILIAWDLHYDEAKASAIVRSIDGVAVPYLSLEDLVGTERFSDHLTPGGSIAVQSRVDSR